MIRSLGAGLLVLGACSPSSERAESNDPHIESPHVVLVTVDTLRADHLRCYGYFRETSPRIDALAEQSVLFESCKVPIATTLPSHVSMLTGMWPNEHGVLANVAHGGKAYKPAAGAVSLAQVLADKGYSTAAFISAKPLRLDSGIAAGFQHFDDSDSPARVGGETTDAALEWMESHVQSGTDQPLFMWVHLFDPHNPFNAPEGFAGTFKADAGLAKYIRERSIDKSSERPGGAVLDTLTAHNDYDAEILYTDHQVGRVLDSLESLGIQDKTAFLLLSDHGEGLGQHGEPGHGLIWDEHVDSVWIMRVPGLAARRVPARVSSVDMLPTLLGSILVPGLEGFTAQLSGVNCLAPG
ncbi:MAG: choline-sulfatase, partial [Candidatus Paceibacteria bacterium]